MSSLSLSFSDHHGPIAVVVLSRALAERLASLVAADEDLAPSVGDALADWRSCSERQALPA